MNLNDLQKLIDVCRSDADLHQPELRPLADRIANDPAVRRSWEKSQQIDSSLRQAIRDVPVPDGLESRLFEALLHADPENACESQAAGSITPMSAGHWRNWKQWSAAVAGVAAILFAAFVLWPANEPKLVTHDDAMARVPEWISQLQESGWQSTNAPKYYPLPAQLGQVTGRWQAIAPRNGSLKIVCYDLTSRNSKAVLFVTRTKQSTQLGAQPPASVYSSQVGRQKWSVAAWKSKSEQGTLVYVLAVGGGNRQYQDLIRRRNDLAARDRSAGILYPAGRVEESIDGPRNRA